MPEPDISALIQNHPELVDFEPLLEIIKKEVSPPTLPEYRHTIQRLLDLQDSLGRGWTLLIATEHHDQLEVLIELLDVIEDFDEAPTPKFRQTTNHPIWAALVTVPPGYHVTSCLLGLSLHLRLKDSEIAPLEIERALRAEFSTTKKTPLLDILADIPPAESPERFFQELVIHEPRLKRARSALFSKLLAAAQRLQWKRIAPDDDEDEDEDLEILSLPLTDDAPELPGGLNEEDYSERVCCELNAKESSASLRMQFVHAGERYRSANGLWNENHCTSLPEEDAFELARWLIKYARNEIKNDQKEKARPAIVTLAMLMTGRQAPQAVASLMSNTDLSKPYVSFNLAFVSLRFPIPKFGSWFSPKADKSNLYVPTETHVSIPLPKRIRKLFSSWHYLNQEIRLKTADEEKAEVADLLRQFQLETNIPAKPGMVWKSLGVFLYARCRDPVVVQWLTNALNGHSAFPSFYACIPEKRVKEAYIEAIWPILAPKAKRPGQTSKSFLGVKGRVKDDLVTDRVKALTNSFSQRGFRENHLPHIMRKHNQLAFYITAMLACLAGHRPVKRLHSLTRWDFDLSLGIALISDKRIDPAHIYRPIALGTKITQQLLLYQRHLKKLRHLISALPIAAGEKLTEDIGDSIEGKAPWFFQITPALTCMPWEITHWNDQLSNAFRGAQPQFGRVVLASHFREAGDKTYDHYGASLAELAHIQLGHLGLVGMPFDHNSALTLPGFAADAGKIMDKLFTNQGWTLQGGLVRSQERKTNKWKEEHVPTWFGVGAAKEERSAAVATWAANEREARRKYLKRAIEDFGQLLEDQIQIISPELAVILRSDREGKEFKKPEQPISLTEDEIKEILKLPRKTRPPVTNILEDILRRLERRGIYKGAKPRRFATPRRPDKTPFLRGMFRARYLFERLRHLLMEEQAQSLRMDGRGSESLDLARMIIALIIYGGVTDKAALIGIINNRERAICNPVMKDSLLVPVRWSIARSKKNPNPPAISPVTWSLWHVPAACLIRYSQLHKSQQRIKRTDIDDGVINAAIEQLLGKVLEAPPQNTPWLDALLDQAKVVRTIEVSGSGQWALDMKRGSWSLLVPRQYAILSHKKDVYSPLIQIPRARQLSLEQGQKRFLKSIYALLPNKVQPVGGKVGSAEYNRLYRTKAIPKLESLGRQGDLSLTEKALVQHTVELLQQKNPDGSPKGVGFARDKISMIGQKVLARLHPLDLKLMRRKDFVSHYRFIIERISSDGQKLKVAKALASFHEVLQREFNVPKITRKKFVKNLKKPGQRVDTRIVGPLEAERTREFLENSFDSGRPQITRPDNRVGLQALIVLSMVLAAGVRSGETHSIRHNEIYMARKKRFLFVQRSLFRDEKTRAARRRICLSDKLSKHELDRITAYLSAEKKRLPDLASSRRRMLIISPSIHPKELKGGPLDMSVLQTTVSRVLAKYCPGEHGPYQIRHSLGTRAQVDMALGTRQGIVSSRADREFDFACRSISSIRIPRDVRAATMLIGHASFQVINRSYGHMPWSYLRDQAVLAGKHVHPKNLCRLLGKTDVAAKKAYTRHKKLLAGIILAESCINPEPDRRKSLEPLSPTLTRAQRYWKDFAPQAIYLVELTRRAVPEDFAVYGVARKDYEAMKIAARQVANCTGIAFFPDDLNDRNRIASSLKRIQETTEPLIDLVHMKHSTSDDLVTVLRSYLLLSDANKRSSIRLLPDARAAFEKILKKYKIAYKVIVKHEDPLKETIEVTTPDNLSVNSALACVFAMCAIIIQAKSQTSTEIKWKNANLF